MPVVTDGGLGIGVEALGTNFPFVDPSDDVRGLLADFYVSHEVRDVVLPLRIVWLYGFCRAQESCGSGSSQSSGVPDPVHEAEVLVVDSDGTVVFDSTTADLFRSKDWGSRFHIYEWQTATAVCRAVVHTGAQETENSQAYPHEFRPENGILDERCSDIVPRRVNKLIALSEEITGSVELMAGYNVTLLQSAAVGASNRFRNRVVLTAQPGIGLGRFPSCDEVDRVIRRINDAGPTQDGGFIMTVGARVPNSGPCYWTELPSEVVSESPRIVSVTPYTLKLNNNCGPCCECEDYENVYHGIRRLYLSFKSIGARGETVRGTFRENRERWLAEKECRRIAPARVSVVRVGSTGYLDVAAAFCNADKDCKYNIRIDLDFSHSQNKTGEVVESSTYVSVITGGMEEYVLGGAWPNYFAYWDAIEGGRTVRVRTRLFFAHPASGDSVTVTATPSIDGVDYPSASKTVTLKL